MSVQACKLPCVAYVSVCSLTPDSSNRFQIRAPTMAGIVDEVGETPPGFNRALYKQGKESSATIMRMAFKSGASKDMALQLGKDLMDIAIELNQAFVVGSMTEPEALDRFMEEARKYAANISVSKVSEPSCVETSADLNTTVMPPPKRLRSDGSSTLETSSASRGSTEPLPGIADASNRGHLQDTLALQELAENEKLFPSAARPSVLVSGIDPEAPLTTEDAEDVPEPMGTDNNILFKDGRFVVSPGDLIHDFAGVHAKGPILRCQAGAVKARNYIVLIANCELAKLHDFVKQQVSMMTASTCNLRVGYFCTSTGQQSSECLMMFKPRCPSDMKKGRPKEITVGLYAGTYDDGQSKGTRIKFMMQAIERLGKAEHFRTLCFTTGMADHIPDKSDIQELLKPYVDFTNKDWESELLHIRMKADAKLPLTSAETLISQHPQQCQRVRVAMKQHQQSMNYVVMVDDPDLPSMDETFDLVELRKLRIVVWEPLEDMFMQADFMEAYPHMLYHRCLMFHGPPGTGKTPLAKAIAKLTAQAHGKPWFVMTNTVDSLRLCNEGQLFQPLVPCVIDEWVAGVASQDPLATKISFVKALCDVVNASTARARFSDIRMPKYTPRIMTTQDSRERWTANLLQMGSVDDVNAVLKRTAWIEVAQSVMKSEAVQAYRMSLQDQGTAAINELLQGLGMSTHTSVTWKPLEE